MFWSICVNAAMAFGMIIILLYCVGDVEQISASSYPLMDICLNATQSVAGASAMLGGILTTIISGTIGSVASVSRLTWAWARDGALPSYFAYVDPKYRIPVRSVWYVNPPFFVPLSLCVSIRRVFRHESCERVCGAQLFLN